jgi:hypothetical protein
MKRSGGAIAPAVLAKKKAPARDILIGEPETDELRAFGGSRSDKFNGVLINALARRASDRALTRRRCREGTGGGGTGDAIAAAAGAGGRG